MARNRKELDALAKLMKKIDVAMLVTVGDGDYLVSRPLSTQAAQFDGERIFFLTEADSPKVAEIRRNGKVNVAYASKDASTYISAAGDAVVRRDQALIDAFWNDAMKAFFPNGRTDPNLTLIEVSVRTIEYWDGPGTWIGKAVGFVIARITGNDDVMGENRIVDVASGRSVKPPGTDRPGTRRPPSPAKAAKKAAKKATTPARTTKQATKGKAKPAATKGTTTRKTAPPKRRSRTTAARKTTR